jgi:hypothetical protein
MGALADAISSTIGSISSALQNAADSGSDTTGSGRRITPMTAEEYQARRDARTAARSAGDYNNQLYDTGSLSGYPSVSYMDYDTAMKQAQNQLEPQYQSSYNDMLNSYQQQRKLLPAQLNARGQLNGGLRTGGEAGLTQRQAMALEQLALQNKASQAELAGSIQNNDWSRAQQAAANQFQAMQFQKQMEMQRYQLEMQRALQENQDSQNNIYKMADYTGTINGAPTLAAQQLGLQSTFAGYDTFGNPTYNNNTQANTQANTGGVGANLLNLWNALINY